jgi:hypothetical protein
VTSPDDQSRICLLEASPMRIASNSLMSIKVLLSSLSLVLDLQIREVGRFGQRPHGVLCFLLR